MLFTATALSPVAIANAQQAAALVQAPAAAAKSAPAVQGQAADPLAAQPALPPAPPPPPTFWSLADVQELLAYITGVGRDGLDPADYDAPGLAATVS